MEASLADEGICPNCGYWSKLIEDTGWCARCTVLEFPDRKVCATCGDLFPRSAQVDKCWTCRREEWLTVHAEAIEVYQLQGYSFTVACDRVADDIRPTCRKCGDEIRGGRRDAKFCKKRRECRRASKQYRALQQQGLTPDDALAIVTGTALILVSS